MPPTHVETPDAPDQGHVDHGGLEHRAGGGHHRAEMDAWAARSPPAPSPRSTPGKFLDEILPLKGPQLDGSVVDFSVDEHPAATPPPRNWPNSRCCTPDRGSRSPRATTTAPTTPVRRWRSSTMPTRLDKGLDVMATVKAWGRSASAARHRTGRRRGDRQGARPGRAQSSDVALWEINEAFASVPIAACRRFHGIDEELVNFSGSGCSLGHPIRASGARMVTTLVYELRAPGRRDRRGGDVRRRRRSGQRGRHPVRSSGSSQQTNRRKGDARFKGTPPCRFRGDVCVCSPSLDFLPSRLIRPGSAIRARGCTAVRTRSCGRRPRRPDGVLERMRVPVGILVLLVEPVQPTEPPHMQRTASRPVGGIPRGTDRPRPDRRSPSPPAHPTFAARGLKCRADQDQVAQDRVAHERLSHGPRVVGQGPASRRPRRRGWRTYCRSPVRHRVEQFVLLAEVPVDARDAHPGARRATACSRLSIDTCSASSEHR